jgi:hypothetical protein
MATHQAIAATAAAIKGLLSERFPRETPVGAPPAVPGVDDPREFPPLDIRICQAKDFETGLPGNGIAIFPWRVAINTQRRARGPRTDVFGNRFKPSLPIDLSFLIIPFATGAEMQLRMLGWVMRAMEDSGPLTAIQLNHFLAPKAIFAPNEEVELVCDPLSVADHLILWDRIKKHPIGINYLIRMVLLDSTQMITEAVPVIERSFEVGMRVDA